MENPSASPSVIAVVYFGEKYIELDDASITLGDLCDAFEVEPGSVFLRERSNGRVVATLPFETVPQNASGDSPLILDLVPTDNEDSGKNADDSLHENETAKVMKQLVDLGAIELLFSEQRKEEEYESEYAPQFLQNVIYPESIYSPFRFQRDPLSMNRRIDNTLRVWENTVGKPYVSSVNLYTVEGIALSELLEHRRDLDPTPLTGLKL